MPTGKQTPIDEYFLKSGELLEQSLPLMRKPISVAARLIIQALKKGNKVMVCGNGGSAADAQHFAAELVGRYLMDRSPLTAIALTTDTSALTAVGNDYGFDEVFARQLKALAKSGDILFCISTSGSSANVTNAAKLAKRLNVKTIGLSGNGGGKLKRFCAVNLIVPSYFTPHIQQVHLAVYHTICQLVESELSK